VSRNSWTIEDKTSGSWVADGTIYRPNEDTSLSLVSTQTKINLANGSQAFVTPSTKYNLQPVVFRWLNIPDTDAFVNKIKNYVINQTYVRITDHNSDTYIGRFINLERLWLSGQDPDTYDLEAEFERME